MPEKRSKNNSATKVVDAPKAGVLPSRELNAYKRMIKCHELQQYKQGLKLSNQILSNPKCSEHPDTLATKAYLLLAIGKYNEGEEAARRGLRSDLRSHESWNALSLALRYLKKYDEAIKCLRNYIRLKPENLEVLRNLAVLTVHTGDFESYREVRFKIFQLKPTQRASWGGVALSYHLLGDYEMCIKILQEYQKSQQDVNREMVGDIIKSIMNKKSEYDFEHSELLKYHVKVLEEYECREEALKLLQSSRKRILDRDFLLDTESKLLKELGRKSEALESLTEILKRNSSRMDVFEKIIDENGLTNASDISRFCSEKKLMDPASDNFTLVMLKHAQNETFQELVKDFLTLKLKKGVPSTMNSLQFIYESEEKKCILRQVLQELVKESLSSPWALFYLAQHYLVINDYNKALISLNLSLEKFPEEPEIYLLKGKVLKHMGEKKAAAEEVAKAFNLDQTDRCIGNTLAKYLLRAGEIKEAVQTMGKFTKPGVDVLNYLEETQCSWFFIHLARAYHVQSNFGEVLACCHRVNSIFEVLEESLFDFHHYSLTKLRLSAYLDLIRNKKKVRCDKYFIEAALLAVETYCSIHDARDAGNTKENTKISKDKHNNKDVNRDNNKNGNKPNNKEGNNNTEKTRGNAKNTKQVANDFKYNSQQLEATDTPLREAKMFLDGVWSVAREDPRTQYQSTQLYIRKNGFRLLGKSNKY